MDLLSSVKAKIKAKANTASDPALHSGSQSLNLLGPDDVYRYRRQYGVNLGSWFVLEKWITPTPFQGVGGNVSADLDIAKLPDAKARLERHWDNWITDDDWKWIKDHGFNSIRLPIGYYHLSQPLPDVLKSTDLEPHKGVFDGAWTRILKAIDKAGSLGLGVLVAAGGQNGEDHSGTSNGKPGLFTSKSNLASTALALRFLASQLSHIPHIVGIQLLNEPANNQQIQGWYEKTISELRPICGPEFPIYVHDAWDAQWYARWVGGQTDFVVLDHHLYRCFTPADNKMTGEQHAQQLRGGFGSTLRTQSGQAKGQLVIGEWSGSLSPDSIGKMPGGEQDRQRREFVRAQIELYKDCTGGWWFWTLKLEESWNAGWSAKNAMQAEILPKWVGEANHGQVAPVVKENELKKGEASHRNYWASHGGSPNPAVFAPGFSQGWDDAQLFRNHPSGTSSIGFLDRWMSRRRAEFEGSHGALGPAAWEWEHGFKQGATTCRDARIG